MNKKLSKRYKKLLDKTKDNEAENLEDAIKKIKNNTNSTTLTVKLYR
jgi:hypothetical protein